MGLKSSVFLDGHEPSRKVPIWLPSLFRFQFNFHKNSILWRFFIRNHLDKRPYSPKSKFCHSKVIVCHRSKVQVTMCHSNILIHHRSKVQVVVCHSKILVRHCSKVQVIVSYSKAPVFYHHYWFQRSKSPSVDRRSPFAIVIFRHLNVQLPSTIQRSKLTLFTIDLVVSSPSSIPLR